MEQKKRFQLTVNAVRYEVDLPRLAVSQVRALAGLADDQMLILEGTGANADRLLRDDEVVSLEEGAVRILATTPATFG